MENHVPTIIGVNVVLICVTVGSVTTRLIRQKTQARKFEAQDVFLVFAGLCGIIMSLLFCIETRIVKRDANGHMPFIQSPRFYQVYMALMIFYMACNMFVKLALLAFYRLLTYDATHRRMITVMTVIAIGFGLSSILVLIFQCQPVSFSWEIDFSKPHHCISISAFYYANASIMIGNDVVLYIMPMIFTRNVQVTKGKRIMINILLSLGAVVLVASVMRLLAVHALMTSGNILWNTALVLLWSAVENHLAIFIACAPAIKSSVSKYFPSVSSIRGSVRRSSGGRVTLTGSKRSSATKSSTGSTIVVKKDIDVDSFYLASRSGSKSSDTGYMTKGYEPASTIIEVDDGRSEIEQPLKAYLRSPTM